MGKCYSDAVEQALEYIYYNERLGKGKEGFELLQKASEAGDGDASCVLARCLCGYQYVWSGHHFPEDERMATRLLHQGVEQGSALAALVCLRTGDMTPTMERKMPFSSLQEAFDIVEEKARLGDAFTQYVVGNSYFWWDFVRIQGKGRDSFANQEAYRAYLKENIIKCEDWFWKAFRGGMYLAGNNLMHLYENGDEDPIPPQPERAKDINRLGAEYGYPLRQYVYATELEKEERKEEAFHWFDLAAQGGEESACYMAGRGYDDGKLVSQDYAKAAAYYEKGLNSCNSIGCHNRLARLYFEGKGVPQDYARAYQLAMYAYEKGNNWSVDYLGKCCFHGWGTQQDYEKARMFLEKVDWNDWETKYMLGYIYGRGLGVPADIKKAVELLQKAGDHREAKEELLHYRKTLFGKWVRR